MNKNVKSQPKGDDEQKENHEELCKGVQDLCKHHHIDAQLRKLAHEQYKSCPREVNSSSSNTVVPHIAPEQNSKWVS